jgi:hypothetical protein
MQSALSWLAYIGPENISSSTALTESTGTTPHSIAFHPGGTIFSAPVFIFKLQQ